MLKLQVEKREVNEKSQDLKKDGFFPAVFYGPKEKSASIKIKEIDFIKTYKEAGESSIVFLNDGSTEHETLIHDVQFDAVSERPIHADFYVIEKGKKVNVHVPLTFVGVAPAEKSLGGVLVKVMHEIEIESMPKDLPSELEIDISSLVDFDSQIQAKDIKLPLGVELLTDPEEVLALVQEAKEEDFEAAPESVDMASVAVEKKGKTEEEEVQA
jgi:large subunit ribosomal protein L25